MMADVSNSKETKLSREGILLQKQMEERKAVQAKIQKIKHGVPKGDKKRKKESLVEIGELEAEMEQRHESELEELKKTPVLIDCVTDQIDRVSFGCGAAARTDAVVEAQAVQKKVSKAQKRRDKKAAQEKERDERIQKGEQDNLTGARNIEAVKLKEILTKRMLKVHEVPSDGNCLYAAIKHQLSIHNITSSVASLRQQASQHMRSHVGDFLFFLSNQYTGEPYTEDEFEKYCDELEKTAAWGGQLEVKALSNVLQFPVEVIQADSPSIITGEEHQKTALLLSYHRHAFGLGEHYNSVIPKSEEDDKEEEFS